MSISAEKQYDRMIDALMKDVESYKKAWKRGRKELKQLEEGWVEMEADNDRLWRENRDLKGQRDRQNQTIRELLQIIADDIGKPICSFHAYCGYQVKPEKVEEPCCGDIDPDDDHEDSPQGRYCFSCKHYEHGSTAILTNETYVKHKDGVCKHTLLDHKNTLFAVDDEYSCILWEAESKAENTHNGDRTPNEMRIINLAGGF